MGTSWRPPLLLCRCGVSWGRSKGRPLLCWVLAAYLEPDSPERTYYLIIFFTFITEAVCKGSHKIEFCCLLDLWKFYLFSPPKIFCPKCVCCEYKVLEQNFPLPEQLSCWVPSPAIILDFYSDFTLLLLCMLVNYVAVCCVSIWPLILTCKYSCSGNICQANFVVRARTLDHEV